MRAARAGLAACVALLAVSVAAFAPDVSASLQPGELAALRNAARAQRQTLEQLSALAVQQAATIDALLARMGDGDGGDAAGAGGGAGIAGECARGGEGEARGSALLDALERPAAPLSLRAAGHAPHVPAAPVAGVDASMVNPSAAAPSVPATLGAAVLNRRFRDVFGERFAPLAVAALPAAVTALHALPQETTAEALARYVAAGDARGEAHLLGGATGELMDSAAPPLWLPLDAGGAVSALGGYVRRRNETVLLVGHTGGAVVAHWLREHVRRPDGSALPDDLRALARAEASSAVVMRSPLLDSDALLAQPQLRRVVAVDAFKVHGVRVVAVAYASGHVELFGERGAPLASLAAPAVGADGLEAGGDGARERVAALRLAGARIMYLAETHAASVMLEAPALRKSTAAPPSDDGALAMVPTADELRRAATAIVSAPEPCRGLNGSTIVAARFDSLTSSRTYALTATGELLTAQVTADKHGKTKCVVRARRPAGVAPPAALRVLKGYVVVAGGGEELAVFNTTAIGPKTAPRPVLKASAADVAAALGVTLPLEDASGVGRLDATAALLPPPLGAGKGRLLALPVGSDGVVATFRSDLPVAAPPQFNTKLWQSPVFVVAMCLVGLWQFVSKRSGPRSHFGQGGGFGGTGGGSGFDKAAFERLAQDHDFGERHHMSSLRREFNNRADGGASRTRFDQYEASAMAQLARQQRSGGVSSFGDMD